MLRSAVDFKTEIQEQYDRIKYDDKYRFLFVHKINKNDVFDFRNDKEDCLEYVSVREGKVIGYMFAKVEKDWNMISNLKILNFESKGNITFAKDLYEFLEGLFNAGFRKLQFKCITENPILKMYIKYVERYGGSCVGTFHDSIILSDGKVYDYILFEVFKKDFDRIEGERKRKNKCRIKKIE